MASPYIIFGLIGVAYALLLKVVAKDPDAGCSSSDYGAVDTIPPSMRL